MEYKEVQKAVCCPYGEATTVVSCWKYQSKSCQEVWVTYLPKSGDSTHNNKCFLPLDPDFNICMSCCNTVILLCHYEINPMNVDDEIFKIRTKDSKYIENFEAPSCDIWSRKSNWLPALKLLGNRAEVEESCEKTKHHMNLERKRYTRCSGF